MKKVLSNGLVLLFAGIIAVSCFYSAQSAIGDYDFSAPNNTVILPDTLHEVSGVTTIDSVTLGCIQDENGILFIYDLISKELRNQYTFHLDGDYEGLAKVNNDMFVLRSDGAIFQIQDYGSPNFRTITHQTDIPAPNNEGFCYDKDNNRLLIGCKGKLGKGKEFKDLRAIYAFNLSDSTLSNEPAYQFDLSDIKEFAEKNNLPIDFKEKKKGSEPNIKFMISGLSIHPKTKDLFVLSAADHLLFIFENSGKLKHIEVLNKQLFNKAEGLTFLSDGTLYITNEAQDKHPTLLQFNYKH